VPRRPTPTRAAAALLLAVAGLLPAAGAAGPDPARFGPDWAPEDCGLFKLPEDDPTLLCGYVSVPLRHGVEGSPRIRLATVVIPAPDAAKRRPDPLFLAQGGPGGSTIGAFARGLLEDPSRRPVTDRDLVLWDQRGTYFSQPRLQCRETDRLPPGASRDAELDAYRRCGMRLAADAHGDLSAFNSQENARDADAVRAALGYEAFNFYGVSYGTELGQFLMRERPQHLRAVVLDAVVPLGFSLVTDVPAVRQRVMEQYARTCSESTRCNAAYPNLGPRYLALLDRLDAAPVPLPAGRSPAGAPGVPGAPPATMNGRDLDAALYQSIYQREAVPLVPYIVDRADQGDYSFVLNFVQLMGDARSDMAEGMYLAVVCSQHGDTPVGALRFTGVLSRLADSATEDARTILEVCRDWRIRVLDRSLAQPVKSDIPTLLLSGSFDPITPPAHAERVAATLSRAYTVTFARGTHGQAFTQPCANRLIAAFLDRPERAPAADCANEAPPVFLTPDELLSLPVRGRTASATLQDQVRALAAPAAVVGLALLLLFSAVPVYAVSEVWRVFRGRSWTVPQGWGGRLVSAAPWMPVLAALTLTGFLGAAAFAVADAIGRNQFLLLVGAVPAGLKSLVWLLLPYALVLALMTLAMLRLWRHRARSRAGRIYFTVLVIAGWGVCVALLRTGLLGG
jgi:pimeloyl-ACP methyl ester carboxylesterase